MPFDNEDRRRPGGRGTGPGTGERAINLPPAVLWLIVVNVAVQLLRQLLGEQADEEILLQFGLVPAAYAADSPDLFFLIVAPITYQFLHGGWMHLGINMLMLAAFGPPIERLLGVPRFVLFYLVCGVVAGLVHVLVYPGSPDPVVGASGSISGVFGAVLMLMRYVGSLTSLLPVAAIWIGLNVFFGLFGGAPGAAGESIAWVAHIAGFVFGLAAIRFFAPRLPNGPT